MCSCCDEYEWKCCKYINLVMFCIYIYIYRHTYIHRCMYIYAYVLVLVARYISESFKLIIYIQTNYIYIYIYMYQHVDPLTANECLLNIYHICVCMYACMYIRDWIYICIYTHIYTYIHTYIYHLPRADKLCYFLPPRRRAGREPVNHSCFACVLVFVHMRVAHTHVYM